VRPNDRQQNYCKYSPLAYTTLKLETITIQLIIDDKYGYSMGTNLYSIAGKPSPSYLLILRR